MALNRNISKEEKNNPSGLDLNYHKVRDFSVLNWNERRACIWLASYIDKSDSDYCKKNSLAPRRTECVTIMGDTFDKYFSDTNGKDIRDIAYDAIKTMDDWKKSKKV